MQRDDVLAEIASRLASRILDHPLRVGIDGIVGAGKSTFARELVAAVGVAGRPAIHVDSDGFHHPRALRHRSSSDEARGYYDNAYDMDALVERVLAPLGPEGSRDYATAIHDLATDEVIEGAVATAPPDAVVVFDCTFLQRGGLRRWWDEVIWLDVDRDVAVRRGVARDAVALGGAAATEAAYDARYMAACDLYLAEEHPRRSASIVVDHNDPTRPRLLSGP